MLGIIHKQVGDFPEAPVRKFHRKPEYSYFKDLKLEGVHRYLVNNKPLNINHCFVHGDFHYANILWKANKISAILDFEQAGYGNKEFDIAWSLILRPNQKFMKTALEYNGFIRGYQSENECDKKIVKYYRALIYSRFIKFGDDEYREYIRNWFKNNI